MVSHHPAKFGDHGHCGSEDMFLVAEKEDYRCSRFNLPLLFISKGHGLKAHAISCNSHTGHTLLKQQLEKILKITFASPSKNAVEKNK